MLKVVRSALERARYNATQRIASKENEHANVGTDTQQTAEHNGRLDCIAGNGVMSELGIGDEPSVQENHIDGSRAIQALRPAVRELIGSASGPTRSAVDALPIVIIKNYASKNSRDREDVLEALAKWTSRLIEFKVGVMWNYSEIHLIQDHRSRTFSL
jgi:hypothetical protein